MSLRTRLVLALLAMALIPTAALVLYARYQIGAASRWWSLPGVERALESSLEIGRGSLARLDATALAQAARWAANPPPPAPDARELAGVRRELREAGLDLLQEYRRHGKRWERLAQFSPEFVLDPRHSDLGDGLDSALASGGVIHTATGLLAAVHATSDGRAVVVGFRVAPGLFADVERVSLGTEYYRGHGVVADIQRVYAWMLALALVVLLLVIALGLSARLAREMSRPLSELSAALGTIAAGDWSARVTPGGAREVRRLGESFNQMARSLESARDALQQAEREAAWREVAQRLAHEFKNILTPMSLSVYVLARQVEQAPAADRDESLGSLERGLSQLARLAEQFSQYARLPEPRLEPLDLGALARTVATGAADARVRMSADGTVPVLGDHLLLSRAIHNLILNACEASSTDSAVEVESRSTGGRGVIEVRDRGTGIPAEIRGRLFQPYASSKRRGSGLGLALVRDIARQHAGEVTLENREGGGAIATLSLPLAPDSSAPGPHAASHEGSTGA